ncbi:MAG: deoxyuridine 5-triphosphate nucleotidohydrolase, dUTP pyrophosphatase [Candidatus Kaiserbacteria bacterium]|nr:deoxyuridine 5-triphosphate nucleotidohydrolase, dUTP pyrophosphatase [Candidatus Kaiserbacteria bacterium]
MKLQIRRLDKTLPLPEYKTEGAAGIDLYVREKTQIPARSIAVVPLNVSIKPPTEHFVLLAPRSSLHKRGLMFANSVGIMDEDYCGDDDEYRAILYNFTDSDVLVARGDRIAQAVILPREKVAIEEVESMESVSRGGIGSTGI